ncbi:hypothetical protein N9L68_03135 [bacterium]|nr:hypothetical protein [bacterium]
MPNKSHRGWVVSQVRGRFWGAAGDAQGHRCSLVVDHRRSLTVTERRSTLRARRGPPPGFQGRLYDCSLLADIFDVSGLLVACFT